MTDTTIGGVSRAVRDVLDDRREKHGGTSYDDTLRIALGLPRRDSAVGTGPDPSGYAPTIHVSDHVKEELRDRRDELGADSFDETLRVIFGLPPRDHGSEQPIEYGPLDGE